MTVLSGAVVPLHAATPVASTTTLTITSGGNTVTSVNSGAVVVLTATVKTGTTAVTPGLVKFCDASAAYCTDVHVLGTAQLTASGTAVYRFRPGLGSHRYKAVFAGTTAAASSTSSADSLTVTGTVPLAATTTTMTRSGSWGDYNVSATVTETGSATSLAGTVSFVDSSNGNAVLGSADLAAGTPALGWVTSTLNAAGLNQAAIAIGDFNEDGIPDLAVPLFRNNQMGIFLGGGNGTFTQTSVSAATGAGPFNLVVGDFNQDGHQDIAVLNANDDTVSILLGDGDGTFTVAASLATGQLPYTIASGDFNGDGIPDLAVVNLSSDNVSIFLGKGDGTFTAASPIPLTNSPDAIVAGDFNGDGKTDLAVAGSSNATTILISNGDGTFTASAGPSLPNPTGNFDSIAVGDFNGDGKLDLAIGIYVEVAGATNAISVYLGNGDGTFAAAPTSATVRVASNIVVADINQDGIADLVVPGSAASGATILLGHGDGTFENTSLVAPAAGPFGIAVADFNGDGRPDLALTTENPQVDVDLTEPTETASTPVVSVQPGAPGVHLVDASYPGDSAFAASASPTVALLGEPPATVAGLAITAAGQPVTTVPADTTVTLTATVTTGGSPLTSGEVNFCDATASSCSDIHLIGSAQLTTTGTAVYRFIPGSGTHQYKAVFQENEGGATSASAAVTLKVQAAPTPPPVATSTTIQQSGNIGDYTLTASVAGAGLGANTAMTGNVLFEDTSYANAVLATVPVGAGKPGLVWANAFSVPFTNPGFIRFAVADFNGDGIPDVAAVSTNGMTVSIFIGKGDGTFTTGATLTLTTYTTGVVAGDFNGDGRIDLAISSVGSGYTAPGSLAIYLGNGDGTFNAVSTAPTVGQFAQVFAAADFNSDGKLDLIVNDGTGTRILLGNGDGTFSQGPVTGLPATIAVADLNGDGTPDLVVSDSQNITAVVIGNGDGTFSLAPSPLPANIASGIATVGDFNGDGIPDLAIATSSYSPVTIFLGKGDGTFTEVSNTSNPSVNEPIALAVGDFNHDGKLDLAISNYNAGQGNTQDPDLTVLLGKGDGTFTAGNEDSQFNGTGALIVADVNGDGVPDVIVDTGSLTVLLTEPSRTVTVTATGINPSGPAPHAVDAVYAGDTHYATSTSGTTSLDVQAATPVISVVSGTYTSTQTVKLTDATPGVTIYYELSGPNITSTAFTAYTVPLVLANQGSYYLAAYASANGYEQSGTVAANYTLNLPPAPAPVFQLAAGVYSSPQSLTVTDPASGVTIYYTTNGQYPVATSSVYSSSIPIATSETVAAYAQGAGYSASPVTTAQYIVSSSEAPFIYTVAGNEIGGYSGDGGLATMAGLNYPEDAVTDAAGNIYIADYNNNLVRKIDAATRIITTIAGTGLAGYSGDNGPATSAELDLPTAVAVDSSGNVYIADSFNNVVRKVAASTGVITTWAGTGTASQQGGASGNNGPATSAPLNNPGGLTLDSSGNLYIADSGDCQIRKVTTSSGIITAVAGGGNGSCTYGGDNGPATSANLWFPTGIAFDSAGNLYIADTQNNVIREVNKSTGVITTVAGVANVYTGSNYSGDGGPATSAHLHQPYGIAVDSSGNLFIADTSNDAIREVTKSTGVINTISGGSSDCGALGGDGGPAASAGVCDPQSVALTAAGNLIVTDSDYDQVREITASSLPPTATTAAPVFSVSGGTYANAQTVSITDATPGAKIYVTLDGSTANTLNLGYRGPLNINGTIKVSAIAAAPGYLASAPVTVSYTITATPPAVVSTIAGTGTYGYAGAGGPAIDAQLNLMNGVATDSSGNVYLADTSNEVIWKIDAASGNISVVAGNGVYGSSGLGGPATSASLAFPSHVAVDGAGNLYIADTANYRVVKVSAATGIISLYAGTGSASSLPGDGGPATAAGIRQPEGLALDAAGNLYIADEYGGAARLVTAKTGIITTVAGGGSGALTNGATATSVRIYPNDIAVDSAGNLYIANFNQIAVVPAGTRLINIFAGNGDAGTSGDGLPAVQAETEVQDMALDSSGNVYFTTFAGTVRMIPAGGGNISTVVGSGYGYKGAEGISATLSGFSFCENAGLAFDPSGSLYLADVCNYRVRKVTFPTITDPPVFSLAPGTYSSAQTLQLTDGTANAVIHYTTDGTAPTANSTAYSGSIQIASTETVKAIAVAPGLAPSQVVGGVYQIGTALEPAISWSAPAAITYGTPLGTAQLDATTSVAGTFTYSPAAGTVLTAGTHTLSAKFTPTNTQQYATVTATVTLQVNQAVPQITWATPASIVFGTPLGSAQLNATASVAGTFVYTPAAGTVLPLGSQTLSASFTPTDAVDYTAATASVVLSVVNPLPVITSLAPSFTVAGGSGFTLTVNGTEYLPSATVYWGGTALATTYVNATQLTALVPSSQIANPGITSVTVETPGQSGGISTAFQFEVDSAPSSGGAAPTFTTTTATVSPGSSAMYSVTLPSSVISAIVSCLNLPNGTSCSYSNGTLTLVTSATTKAGTYTITVVFAETLSGAAAALSVPLLLLPLALRRRKVGKARIIVSIGAVLMLTIGAVVMNGCGGGGGGGTVTGPQTHQATNSGTVTLIVQ